MQVHDPLDSRTRELIGIAASIAGHCQPCFAYHYREAVKVGVPPEAIRAAMQLAKAVRASGDRHMDESAARQMTAPNAGAEDELGLSLPEVQKSTPD
jgi:AhpD family alkylhydroperoxidase